MNRLLLIVAGVGLTSALSGPALANAAKAGTSDTDLPKAKAAYAKGYEAYDKKKYAEGLAYFRKAVRFLPKKTRYARTRNEIRFYLGMCHKGLGKKKEAVRLLKRYLTGPGSKERKLEATRVLKQLTAPRPVKPKPQTTPGPSTGATLPPPGKRPTDAKAGIGILPWITVGAGVAVLAAGGVVGVLAKGAAGKRDDHLAAGPSAAGADVAVLMDNHDSAKSQAMVSNVLLVSGGVVAAAGAVFVILRATRKQPSKVAFGLSVDSESTLMTASGRF